MNSPVQPPEQQRAERTKDEATAKLRLPLQSETRDGPEVDATLELQRTVGNRAVLHLLREGPSPTRRGPVITPAARTLLNLLGTRVRPAEPPAIQTDLPVSLPGDACETEAEHVAERVVTMETSRQMATGPSSPPAQRPPDAEEESGAQGEDATAEPTPVQAPRRRVAFAPTANAGAVRRGTAAEPVSTHLPQAGPGRPLDAAARAFMEPRFGVDLGDVRVHTGPDAAASAEALSAKAYTVGRDIVFGEGRYEQAGDEGKRLLAHELTHVLQQANAGGGSPADEMIPGFSASHGVHIEQSTARPALQRAKIDYKQLTWNDFTGDVQKKSPRDAITYTDFNQPDFKGATPSEIKAAPTGGEAYVGDTEEGEAIMAKLYGAEIPIDASKLKVSAYMWQEKSWKKDWLDNNPEARRKECMDRVVPKCEAELKSQIEKKVSPMEYSYELVGGHDLFTKELDQCKGALADECAGEGKATESSFLLGHEQGHFDITYLRATETDAALRALVEGFEAFTCAPKEESDKAASAKASTEANAEKDTRMKRLRDEYLDRYQKWNDEQDEYDARTNHAQIQIEQELAQAALRKELAQLAAAQAEKTATEKKSAAPGPTPGEGSSPAPSPPPNPPPESVKK